jgi:hypothetical protein
MERAALTEALSIARRSHLLLATGWTPQQLDEQDPGELESLSLYIRIRDGLEAEEQSRG